MMSIYKITDTTNNKIYVGQTSRNIYVRFSDHISRINSKRKNDRNCKLYIAMREHGKDKFTIDLLEQFDGTVKQADEREKYWIKTLDSMNSEIGYNTDEGGHTISENCRKARIKQMSGNKLTGDLLKIVRDNGMKEAKPICLFDTDGNLLYEFESIIDASRKINCDRRSIQRALQKVYKYSIIKKLNNQICIWKYKDQQ